LWGCSLFRAICGYYHCSISFFLYCTELAEVPRPHADRVRQVAADPWANTIHDAHFVIDDEHAVDNNIIIYRDARKKLQSCRK